MKKIIFVSAFILLSGALKAQEVTYKAESFNNTLSPFKVSLNATFYRSMFQPAFGATVEGVIANRIAYHGTFLYSPWNNFLIKYEPMNDAGDKLKKEKYFEAGADLFLFSWSKEGKGKFKVTTSNDGVTERYFIARTDIRKTFAVRGGVVNYNLVRYYNVEDLTGTVGGKDGEMAFRNFAMFGGYAGIAFRKIKKARITTGGWIHYKNHQRIFYMDVMTAGGVGNAVHYQNTEYKPDTKIDALGYRMGFQWDQQGTITTLEFGKQPSPSGPKDLPWAKYYNYMTLGFSFTIFGGDKRYGMSEKKS